MDGERRQHREWREAETTAVAFYEIMFGAANAIARLTAGVEVIPGFALPTGILVADNLPSSTEFFPLVPDIVEHFTEFWVK